MTVYNNQNGSSTTGFRGSYQSDYVTQGKMIDIYYSWQVVSENCRHGIVISKNNTCIVYLGKYCYVLLLYGNFVIPLQSSIFASLVMFKTFTESYQMT